MTKLRSSFGKDRYELGEWDYLVADSNGWVPESQQPKVVYCHENQSTATSTANHPILRGLVRSIAKAGYTTCAADLAGTTYGNAAGRSAVSKVRRYLWDDWGPGVTPQAKVGLVGVSHGGALALAYANQFPDRIAWIALCQPALSLADLKVAAPSVNVDQYFAGGYSDAAYGIESSPVVFASTMDQNIPIHIWTASNDPVCRPGPANQFLNLRPNTSRTDLGPVGHGLLGVEIATPDMFEFALSQF